MPYTIIGRVLGAKELEDWSAAPNSGVSMICRIDRLLPAMAELKAGKSTATLRGAMLGIMPDPSQALSDRVVIGEVLRHSPAEKAGLKAGDHIVTLDGEPLDDWKGLRCPHRPAPTGRHDQGGNRPQRRRGRRVTSDTKVVTVTLGEMQ